MFQVWSNFEIADMDFWRTEAYSAYFDYLDKQGGFYYEVRSFLLHLWFLFVNYFFRSVGAMHQFIV
jgi:hypothetical protein